MVRQALLPPTILQADTQNHVGVFKLSAGKKATCGGLHGSSNEQIGDIKFMERKIRRYTIASENTTGELVLRVNNLIAEGWEPFGPMLVSHDAYHQPMVHYKAS